MKRLLTSGLMAWGMMAALLAAGCGGGGQSASTTPATVTVNVTGSAQVRLGSTAQYTAAVSNSSNQAVSWQVNNVAGGNSSVGTISAAGLYTPPDTLPSGNAVTITAVSEASSTASSSIAVSLLNPQPTISSAATDGYGASGSSYVVDVLGHGFLQNSVISVNGGALSTTYVSPTELTAIYTLSAPSDASINVVVTNPDPGASTATTTAALQQATATAAARLLDQASFGPTLDSIAAVQRVGLKAYIDQQFATNQTTLADLPTTFPSICPSDGINCLQSQWWNAALNGDDQLRQRVAFALSQIMVTSAATFGVHASNAYLNILYKDAFTNYRTLMGDMTVSPSMGWYLNMINSSTPANNCIANENYARELMQLFTIGLYQLNSDGTLKLDGSGNTIPSYTEAQIGGISRAFTGWTFSNADGSAPTRFPNQTWAWKYPMQPVASQHDSGAKTILNDVQLSAGQTPQQDLDQTLDVVFAHPNVGPFISKQLIQHLVSSAPSAAYVGRVTAVFDDNGSGVRGDMKAVVRAILLDPEARANDVSETAHDGGHLREPALYMSAVMRGLNFVNTDSNAAANYTYWTPSGWVHPLGEYTMFPPSVFNYFPINYQIPGTTLLAPEFGLENAGAVITRINLADTLVMDRLQSFHVDLSASSTWGQLAANDPQKLVDALNKLFMHNQMPSEMKTIIVNYISGISGDPAQRVRAAVYLIITSSQYKVMH